MDRLIDEFGPSLVAELEREAAELVPVVKERLGDRRGPVLPSARFVLHHAPAHPGVHERRWYERFGPLVRLHALYDLLRGFPAGAARPSAEVAIPAEGEVPSPTGSRRS